MSLIERIRKAREREVEVGGFTFTVRRPTDLEMMRMADTVVGHDIQALLPYVIGWAGVKEVDLIAGGDAAAVPFDAAVCSEWLMDRPDIVAALIEAIISAYRAHRDALEAALKN